jgi:hypothetical protein
VCDALALPLDPPEDTTVRLARLMDVQLTLRAASAAMGA